MRFPVSRFPFFIPLLLAIGSTAFAQQPVGELFASDVAVQGSVQLTGSGVKVMSGANVSAGDAAARLQLTRGGELRVCPGTSVSVSASASGRDLMFGMGTGAIETDYQLGASADTLVTPDFSVQLPGPGRFQFAVRSYPNGDTCILALASNTASLVVSELMGDGTYQVKPNEQVLFRKGRLRDPDPQPPAGCGCPPPAPVLRAAATPDGPREQPVMSDAATAAAVAPPAPNVVHLQVESPFVFRAEDYPGPAPAVARADLRSLPPLPTNGVAAFLVPPQTASPARLADDASEKPKPKRRGFARLRAFFAAIFR